MYGKYYGTVMDFQGKIQAAGITAGASMANAKAQQEANAIRQAEVTRANQAREEDRADTLKLNEALARERLAATNYANATQRQNAIRTYVQSDPAVVSLKKAGENWANLPDSPEYKKNQALLQAAQNAALEEFHRIETQFAARGKGAGTPPPPPGFQIPK
jgi:vacuolar-type H+-ATPase subunit E/Vma4